MATQNSNPGWGLVAMMVAVLMTAIFGAIIYNGTSNIKTQAGTSQYVSYEEFQAMANQDAEFTTRPFTAWDRASVSKIIDKETGCEYLMMQWNITPRLDSSGKPICKGSVQHE